MRLAIDPSEAELDRPEAGQRAFDFAFRLAAGLDRWEHRELTGVIEAWYLIGFWRGFAGSSFHQLGELEYRAHDQGDTARFRLLGNIRRDALDVLVRCLENPDHDIVIDELRITVVDNPSRPPS